MKKVLIISPYFPPVNAADMQRVRMSLPYFKAYGWDATVIAVDEKYADQVKDTLLVKTLPADIKIYKVKAFNKKLTNKLGLGSIALRSLWFYRQKGNEILQNEKFDLVYFSTTQFPVCILGAYWKTRFKVPYIIDMQDPWYTDYYEDKPKNERPPKYHLVYGLHKKLEAIAMRKVDGLISVSENYVQTLQQRYANTNHISTAVITFGAFDRDFNLVREHANAIKSFAFDNDKSLFNCVYIGRGGHDMEKSVALLFEGFEAGLQYKPELFSKFRFYFLGTSYAPEGTGKHSILPVAHKLGVAAYVVEQTDRLPFYESIAALLNADGLIIPGSDSPGYTASKIYPYIMAQKPLLGIFREDSSAVKILRECSPTSNVFIIPATPDSIQEICAVLEEWAINKPTENPYSAEIFKKYSADEMTRRQVELFNRVISGQ